MAGALTWAEVHRRLQEIVGELATRTAPAPAEEERRLRERAAALAAPRGAEGTCAAQWLEFTAAGSRWVLPEGAVREVLPLRDPAPIPGSPPHVRGMFLTRGRVVCLYDLGVLLGGVPTGPDRGGVVVVVGGSGGEIGLTAEDVAGFRDGNRVSAGTGETAVVGVSEDGAWLLDPAALLGDPRVAGSGDGEEVRE